MKNANSSPIAYMSASVSPWKPSTPGEYVAISPEGKAILGPSVREVLVQAKTTFGPGNFIFKVGEKAVGKWR